MKGMEHLDRQVLMAGQADARNAGNSPRVVLHLLTLAELCRRGNSWRTIQVTDEQLKLAQVFVPDLSEYTPSLVRALWGVLFLLPRPVEIAKDDEIEHVAVAHVTAGICTEGLGITFPDSLLIYASANKGGIFCGHVNMQDQPTVGQIKLLQRFSWSYLDEGRRAQRESHEIGRDAMVLGLAVALCDICLATDPK
jgi:hypothetical protein